MVAPQAQQEALRAAWTRFEGALNLMQQRLLGELEAAWGEVSSQLEFYRAVPEWASRERPRASDLEGFQQLLASESQRFNEPVDAYLRRRPMERALGALQQFRRDFDNAVRGLPVELQVSSSKLASVCLPDGPAWKQLAGSLRRRGRAVLLRARADGALKLAQQARTELDGRFQQLMAKASLHLVMPVHAAQEYTAFVWNPDLGSEPPLRADREWWIQEAARIESSAAALIEEYRKWAAGILPRVGSRALTGGLDWRISPDDADEAWQESFAFWAGQARSVERMLGVSRELAALNPKLIDETRQTVRFAEEEHAAVSRELDRALAWLEAWKPGETAPFPLAEAALIPAAQRTETWTARLTARIRAALPEKLKIAGPRSARPPRWRRGRLTHPVAVMVQALEGSARKIIAESLAPVEAMHSRAVTEIERAREVVAFSHEVAAESGESNLELEAIANSRGLLDHCRTQMREIRPTIEAGAIRSHSVLVLQSQVAVGVDLFGAWATLTGQRGKRLLLESVGIGLTGTRGAALRAALAVRAGTRWFLLKTGLEAPPPARIEPVQVTQPLSALFERPLGERELPALYRRLFRLAPLDDIRFLVGRDEETRGLRESFDKWQSGTRSAAVVIGARGSGKTSLLNCVAGNVFTGVPIYRGSFRQRASTPEQAERFLRELLGLAANQDLRDALGARKQVIIIEEIERSFLGVINGFGGLRWLLTLMDETASSVFWVIVMNDAAYQYLNVAVRLGEYFPYRISAMSVRSSDLQDAILQRHHLSGLRIEYAPPIADSAAVEALRRLLGATRDSQKAFFEALYRQSEGLFRSAFELWQDSIERVEAGVVYMRQPLEPDYRSLQAELTQDDHFALVAILRHGSMDGDELSSLFSWPAERSTHRLKRLEMLELVEPDPMGPGRRIRPQAIRFVRETLLRQNLL
jgi:hypothetical protein